LSAEFKISNRLRNLIVIILALSYLSFCAWSIITTKSWINRPFPGFLVMKNNFVPVFFLPEWEGPRAGIKSGNIIIAVNGQPVANSNELDRIVLKSGPGKRLTYTVVRAKQEVFLTIPVSLFSLRDYLLLFSGCMILGLVFYLMGIIVFYLKPNDPGSWAFLSLGLAMGLGWASAPEQCTAHHNYLPLFAVPLAGASILLVSLYFPSKIKARRYFQYYIIFSLPPLIFLYLYFFFNTFIYSYIDKIVLLNTITMTALSVFLMIFSFVTSSDPLTRQKAKVVIYGSTVTCLTGIIGICGVSLFKILSIYWLLGLVIPACMLPISVGYAIVNHNLFDVDLFIRRSASYFLVSGIAVMMFLALVALFSLALQKITGQSSQIAAVLSTLLLVAGLRPLKDRIDRAIDRRFFREKCEYQQTIQKASEYLVTIIELNELLQKLLDTVMGAIKIERGGILLRQDSPAQFESAVARGYEIPYTLKPLEPNHPIILALESKPRAFQINDVQEFDEFQPHREYILKIMNNLGIVLVIPIFFEKRLIGILGLGAKKSGAWYSSEDIDLLQTLMNQTAVSIENARKVEELKKMVELETSYRELKKIGELKDNFLAMVSHDLRTPMTSIQGYTSILIEKMNRLDPERQKHYLEIIQNESMRLTRLINDLLDLQRFEAGRMQLELKDIDLVKIVREIAESFQGAALAKKQILETSLPEEEIPVNADPDRLSQVIANLLSNATKFTPEQGKISVNLEKISQDGKPMVKVSVKDNGPGIPIEMQAKIFDKFQQLDNPVQPKEKGSGLGLALVREIIEHHQGEVGVESEPGKGATFYFVLPILR